MLSDFRMALVVSALVIQSKYEEAGLYGGNRASATTSLAKQTDKRRHVASFFDV